MGEGRSMGISYVTICVLFLTLLYSITQGSFPTECRACVGHLPGRSSCLLSCHQSVLSSLSERQQSVCDSLHTCVWRRSHCSISGLSDQVLGQYLRARWLAEVNSLLFFTLKLLCLFALLLLFVWMVMMLLFPRDYLFLTESLSVFSRYWFWQLRNCPVPNSMGRQSILVLKSLVSSSFQEVTVLRAGEELLMRGSKARLGDSIWWGQKQTKVKSTKNKDTWSCCTVLSGKNKCPSVKSGHSPKESQINTYLKLRSLSILVQSTNSCSPLPAGRGI